MLIGNFEFMHVPVHPLEIWLANLEGKKQHSNGLRRYQARKADMNVIDVLTVPSQQITKRLIVLVAMTVIKAMKFELDKKMSVGEDYDLYNSSCKARCV